MFLKNKRASIFVYVIILINIALIIWYVVYNTTYILNNNINIWKNNEEVFSKLSDKASINIESVRQYNSNGNWFTDFVSCPENITMTWTDEFWDPIVKTSISSQMSYDLWESYCWFRYDWEDWRIYFDDSTYEFTTVYYDWELLNILNDYSKEWSQLDISIEDSTSSYYSPVYWTSFAIDWDESTEYISTKVSNAFITIDLWSEYKLYNLKIYKDSNNSYSFWNNWTITLMDSSKNVLSTKTVTWVRKDSLIDIDFNYSTYSDADEVRYIKIKSDTLKSYLDISEIVITQLDYVWVNQWAADWTIDNSYNSLMTFDSTGVWWYDDIDDNMNSDNYRSTSTWDTWYPWDFLDDDITPRITVFWSVDPKSNDWINVFWNNYLTQELIESNIYNDDNPSETVKIWEVSDALLYFDLFSTVENLDYDFKILVFDKDKYENEYTLYPLENYETENITDEYWYLQYDSENKKLSLSTYKTWNEFIFDFSTYDYALFFKNNEEENLAIRITWEEETSNLNNTWKIIYLNPINDSIDWTIETITNHIIIWWEKNFIWENFLSSWSK